MEGVKWRMGKGRGRLREENGNPEEKGAGGEVIEEDGKLRMEMDEGEELPAEERSNDPAFDTFLKALLLYSRLYLHDSVA